MDSLLSLVDRLPDGGDAPGLRGAAAALPFSSYIALEWRSGEANTLSLCAHVPPRKGGWRRFHPGILGSCLDEDAAWSPVVQSAYLEFDAPFEDEPAVFLALRQGLSEQEAVVRKLTGLMTPEARIPDHLLPHVSHVAAMPARSRSLLRLNLLGGGLARIAPLKTLAAGLADVTGHCLASVDVIGGALSDRLGLECYVKDWKAFFRVCARRGWCSDADVARWLSWPGEAAGPADGELPDWARWTGRLLGAQSVLVRTLNHAKLIARPGRAVQMKLYPAVHHVWR